MADLAIYVLGPPQITLGGEPVHASRRKAVALLAYLATTRPGPNAPSNWRR